MQPKFNLLMLTHNNLEAAQRCFESLENTLKRSDVWCFVLDNASHDGTAQYLQELTQHNDKIVLLLSGKNPGVAGGRQQLLDVTPWLPFDVIIFLDSDVVVEDDEWLDLLGDDLKDEKVGLAGPGGSYVKFFNDSVSYIPALVGECDVVSGWCQAFKGEVLGTGVKLDQEYGLFWEEDSDFCLQIREAGWDVVCIGDIGVRHAASASGGSDQRAANLRRFRNKWQGKKLIRTEGAY